jgi:hypothetical protein
LLRLSIKDELVNGGITLLGSDLIEVGVILVSLVILVWLSR